MTLIKIEQTGLTDIGNVRKANEDNFGFIQGKLGPIFTVCDGMGGHVGGATASKIAVNRILEYLSTSNLSSPAVEINNAIVLANQEILETAAANPELKGMGTTCTVMIAINDSVHIGHVGDSRIYLLSNNKLHRITKDHSFVQNLVDSGAISDNEAESHPRKNELTRALGVRNLVEPTTNANPIQPKQGDVFMLCSDGLCGLVNDSEMQNILNQHQSLDAGAQALIMAAKQAGGHDNITVQLARVTESPYKTSSFPDYSPKENLSRTFVQVPYEQPKAKPSFIKSLTLTHWLVFSLLVVALSVGIYYFINSRKTDDTTAPPVDKKKKEEVKNNEKAITDNSEEDDEINSSGEVNQLEIMNCDKVEGDYLVHIVSEQENTYNPIKNRHQNYYMEQFDFSSVFNQEGSKINPDKIVKGKGIKWKKKTPVIVKKPKDPKTPANIPAGTIKKDTSKVNTTSPPAATGTTAN